MESNPAVTDFVKEKESAYQRVFSQLPRLTSLEAGWSGIHLVYDRLPPSVIPEVAAEQHGIAIYTEVSPSTQMEHRAEQHQQAQLKPGDIIITPARSRTYSQWNAPLEVIFLGFDPIRFAQSAEESFGAKSVELLPQFAMTDPLIHQMGIALRTTLQQDKQESRLYAETMANALIVHLLQRYTAQQAITPNQIGGLSPHKQKQVIDYIQAHIEKNLGLEELATLVQLSSHHFCECFKQSIGMSPRQFVIHCRIERAKELLLRRKQSIAEIAQTVGFLDQSHLHRHFKRLVGVTPRQFQQGVSIN